MRSPRDDARDDENQLLQGDTLHVHWAEIPGADQLTDVQTEAAADAAGAFGFVRIEDGEFRPNAKREFWFNTTGDQAARPEADPHTNELGRLYRLRFDGADPLAGRDADPGLQRRSARPRRRTARSARTTSP